MLASSSETQTRSTNSPRLPHAKRNARVRNHYALKKQCASISAVTIDMKLKTLLQTPVATKHFPCLAQTVHAAEQVGAISGRIGHVLAKSQPHQRKVLRGILLGEKVALPFAPLSNELDLNEDEASHYIFCGKPNAAQHEKVPVWEREDIKQFALATLVFCSFCVVLHILL